MSDENPSILSHVSLGTNDYAKATAFYDAVLPTLGCKRIIEHEDAVAYGRVYPEFWVHPPLDDGEAGTANGSHIAFFARSKAEVDAFHAAAIAAGGEDAGAPGPRPHYGEPYYGAFALDLDGHKIEATFWDTALAEKIYGKG